MKKKKKYWEMNAEELSRATKHFDRPMVATESRPLTSKEQQIWQRVRRKPGRPRQGSGVQVISVSVEKELLAQSDALAKKMHLSRAGLIARGLKAVLAVEGVRS